LKVDSHWGSNLPDIFIIQNSSNSSTYTFDIIKGLDLYLQDLSGRSDAIVLIHWTNPASSEHVCMFERFYVPNWLYLKIAMGINQIKVKTGESSVYVLRDPDLFYFYGEIFLFHSSMTPHPGI
jgi:hypothetical protein